MLRTVHFAAEAAVRASGLVAGAAGRAGIRAQVEVVRGNVPAAVGLQGQVGSREGHQGEAVLANLVEDLHQDREVDLRDRSRLAVVDLAYAGALDHRLDHQDRIQGREDLQGQEDRQDQEDPCARDLVEAYLGHQEAWVGLEAGASFQDCQVGRRASFVGAGHLGREEIRLPVVAVLAYAAGACLAHQGRAVALVHL